MDNAANEARLKRPPTISMAARTATAAARLRRLACTTVTRSFRTKTIEQARRVKGPARLIVLAGPQAGRRCELPERSVLGRAIGSPIVLEDAGVSRRHVEIRKRADGGWELEDLGSQNGVRLNGVPVTQHELFVGDKIQLGPNVLLLFTDRGAVEEQLLEKQKLELVGRVAVGVAHDFNNVLGVLAASASFLRAGGVTDPSEVDACLHDIEAAIEKGARLANRLVGFARGSQEGRSTVDVSKVCREIAQMSSRFSGSAIRLELQVEPDLFVIADVGELEQVLMNLCVNARDAMPNGGVITINARSVTVEHVAGEALAEPAPYIQLTVRDTGSGIEPVHLGRIFEPFFTTKGAGAGFGVGLATVKEIVTLHGGGIEVESDVGKGTAFHVFLPATLAGVSFSGASARRGQPDGVQGQGRRVLVVDDDTLVRRSISRLVTRMGFEVVEASSGEQALDVYGNGPAPYFVLLDLEMPGIDGLEVLQRLRSLDPRARILVASGHRQPAKEDAVRASGGVFLGKPFQSAELSAAMRSMIAESAASEDLPTIETKALRRPDKP
jgi:signal transduction histidine kinase/ActR/RegA family two-component response regulator